MRGKKCVGKQCLRRFLVCYRSIECCTLFGFGAYVQLKYIRCITTDVFMATSCILFPYAITCVLCMCVRCMCLCIGGNPYIMRRLYGYTNFNHGIWLSLAQQIITLTIWLFWFTIPNSVNDYVWKSLKMTKSSKTWYFDKKKLYPIKHIQVLEKYFAGPD